MRKRTYAEGLCAYLAVNGVFWLVWLLDAWRADGSGPIARDRPLIEDEIERELRRTSVP